MNFLIPPEHHVADTDRAEAARMLGSASMLDRMIHNGLTVRDGRFDSRDLFNLGLHSGTGRTVPEQTFAFALRWMRSDTVDLVVSRWFRFALTLRCSCPTATFARPRAKVRDPRVEPTAFEATVRTMGSVRPIRSPALLALMREFFALGLRWVKLPTEMRRDENLITSHRVANCETASRYLVRRCEEAGLPATIRIGWVAGMLDLVHTWIEVRDEDGVIKVVDPIFSLFASILPGANAGLTDPTVAFRVNRLIPTDLTVGDPVVTHDCDITPVVKIRQIKETP